MISPLPDDAGMNFYLLYLKDNPISSIISNPDREQVTILIIIYYYLKCTAIKLIFILQFHGITFHFVTIKGYLPINY